MSGFHRCGKPALAIALCFVLPLRSAAVPYGIRRTTGRRLHQRTRHQWDYATERRLVDRRDLLLYRGHPWLRFSSNSETP